ncbi:MAG TPA: prepilin-type N-terminal cleavage/methylation domain-containing protein [Mycobacteriales bacterium]|nr:prepilin-type N-terminal cleavage/methylation domain-containing protein [Mycobacteriales bacterium]
MCQRLGGCAADAGFGMVEMMAALIVIAIASAASAAFFITSLGGSNGNKTRTTAAYVADEELEQITSLPASDLVFGRTKTAVTALWATAAATRLKISSQDDESSTSDYDSVTTHTPYIPTQTSRTVNGTFFNLYNFIDVCWMDVVAGTCGPNQSPANGDSTTKEYRASVDVYWVSNGGCHAGCDYSTSTLIDPSSDPTFNSDLDIPVISSFTPSSFDTNNTLVDAATPCVVNGVSHPNSGDLVQVVTSSGLDAGATIRVSTGGASAQPTFYAVVGTSEIDFCLQTADTPGNYFVTVLNPDGGHANEPITENGIVTSAAWNSATQALTLTGTGFEPDATVADSGSSSCSTAGCITNNYSSGSFDTAVIPSYTPPTNGANDTITITNPDTTSITYTIYAPKVTSSGLTAYGKLPNNLAIAGSAFQSGMSVSLVSGNCTGSSVAYNSTGSASLSFTGGTVGTKCVFRFINSDGGSTSTFSVTNEPYPPQVSSVSPTFVEVSTTTTLTLVGTGFESGMTATTSGSSCSSATNVSVPGPYPSTSATLNLTSTGSTGSCTITLTNPDGGTTSFTETVTRISISGMTESSKTVRRTTTYTWTVTGTAFSTSGLPTVTLSETASGTTRSLTVSAVTVNSSSQLTFNATPFNTGRANYTVTVTNPSGSQASFTLSNFTVS